MKYDSLEEMLWADFLWAWAEIGEVYACHEAYRLQGFEVSFNEQGTVIRHPGTVCYMDSI